ncbi:hypothetical protein [Burkholderia territorii]|uniref:hypothetical protein n=1 Tax=Burkholderia territorii TaxID=1503055 RepID=UPI0007B7F4B9|nr:hypothetical protein [Burkholderia territorii]
MLDLLSSDRSFPTTRSGRSSGDPLFNRKVNAMTGNGKRSTVSSGDAHRVAPQRAADADRSATTRKSFGERRPDAIWAWAKGTAGYDWMDHAPLFDHRD